MYTGPSARSLGLSLILHVGTVAALFSITVPVPAPPEVAADPSKPTEIRIAGKLYYVSQIQGSQTSSEPSPRRNAPVAAATGVAAVRKLPLLAAPIVNVAPQSAPMPVATALAPLPEPVRVMRQQARAFIPPQLKPNPTATQTLIQPLSPLDVTPPPTPLPNFRITAENLRRIPKPFVAPGRVTPPTPPQSPTVETPAMELVPSVQMPPGEPIAVLSLNDRPIPFSDKVVVPAGNVAQPPVPATADAPTAGSSTGTATAASGGAPNGTPGAAPGASASAANARGASGGGSPGGSPTGTPSEIGRAHV